MTRIIVLKLLLCVHRVMSLARNIILLITVVKKMVGLMIFANICQVVLFRVDIGIKKNVD